MARTSTSGQGRPKGVPNKLTATVREHFERAFNLLQDDDEAKLEAWAKVNKTEFYKLASKLIPAEVNANVRGVLNVVSGVPEDDDDDPSHGLV